MKTFYIETFGCQMNAHDSEKVIGTLLQQGYSRWKRPRKPSWSSTTPAASAIRPSRRCFTACNQFKRDGKGKTFAVLGCVAQQEGEKIFEKAPHVSLVCGSASYNQLPQMLVQLETGNRRVTGLSLDTDETFDTPLTRRDNPHRAYITIIEGCDKSCAYCVVPFTRGPERSRTSASVIAEARQLAGDGLHRDSTAGPEREQLSRSVAGGLGFRDAARRGRAAFRASAACASPLRIRAISCKSIVDAIDANPALCNHVHLPVQSGSTRVLDAMQRLYTREEYMRADRLDEGRPPRRSRSPPISSSGSRARRKRISKRRWVCSTRCGYDSIFSFKYSRRPNTSALALDDQIPEEEKTRRLTIVQEHQREIQIRRNAAYVGTVEECLVEGFNKATGQWIGPDVAAQDAEFPAPGRGRRFDGAVRGRAGDARRSEFAGGRML